jgi:hypothetical protein
MTDIASRNTIAQRPLSACTALALEHGARVVSRIQVMAVVGTQIGPLSDRFFKAKNRPLSTLSRVRKQFNTLLKKLEAERVRLALWREELPRIRALADSAYSPLARTFDGQRRQLLLLLDQACSDKAMGKKGRGKLADMICSTALDLMPIDAEDETIKAIYNKYSGCDFDLDMDAEKAFMRAMVGAATGVELDDDTDFSSPHTLFEAMRDKMEEREREEEQQQEQTGQARAAKPAKSSARGAPTGRGAQTQAVGARHLPQARQRPAPGPRDRFRQARAQDSADAARKRGVCGE